MALFASNDQASPRNCPNTFGPRLMHGSIQVHTDVLSSSYASPSYKRRGACGCLNSDLNVPSGCFHDVSISEDDPGISTDSCYVSPLCQFSAIACSEASVRVQFSWTLAPIRSLAIIFRRLGLAGFEKEFCRLRLGCQPTTQ